MGEFVIGALVELVPKKYRNIRHGLIIIGGIIIIFCMIYELMFLFSNITYIIIRSLIGPWCLIIGLSGIYFSKTKKFGSVRKSEEKEGIEQKRAYEIYVFYVITIIGIAVVVPTRLWWILVFIQRFGYLNLFDLFFLIGYLLLISGLLSLYFKYKKILI